MTVIEKILRGLAGTAVGLALMVLVSPAVAVMPELLGALVAWAALAAGPILMM